MAKRLLNLTIVLLCVADVQGSQCVSPQYIQLGKNGTIECDLQEPFYLLSWYDSTNYVNDNAVLYVVSPQLPRGKGYDSGEYDVTPKGSLVINNVSMKHERYFSRTSLRSSDSPQKVDIVQVIVIVPSDPPFPVIKLSPDQADSGDYDRISFLQSEGNVNLECSVSDVRPTVELTWSVRTATGSRPIPAIHTSHYEDGGLVTTRVNLTTDLDKSLPLTLLTCTAAAEHEEVVRQNQSMVLVDNVSVYPSQAEGTRTYVELNSSLDITCTATNYRYLVWKKGAVNPQTIAFSLFVEDDHFQKVLVDGYQLSKSDSLIIPNVGVQEEGFYWCTFSDDISWNSTLYDVIAFVIPSELYPLVDQCRGKPDCAMRIHGGEGTVTCNLTGIRPKVTLNWTTFYESDSGSISFRTQSLTTSGGPTFNVSLTSQFEARDKQIKKLTIECKAYGNHGNLFPLSAKVKLLFAQEATDPLPLTPPPPENPVPVADLAEGRVVEILTTNVIAAEASREKAILVAVNFPSSEDMTISFATGGGDRVTVTDVVIPAGQLVGAAEVTIIDDEVPDPRGTTDVIVKLTPSRYYNVGQRSTATMTILDDDTDPILIGFTSSDVIVKEDAGDVTINLSLNKINEEDLTINFRIRETDPPSALDGVDFMAETTSYTVPAGMRLASVTAIVLDDDERERSETFVVEIDETTLPPNVEVVGETYMTIHIQDSDGCPDEYFNVEDMCFRKEEELLDFDEAREACQQSGADLASASTPHKNMIVSGVANGDRCWVGAVVHGEEYTWLNGDPWEFTHWRKREPNWNRKPMRACIETNFVRPTLWNDHFCRSKRPSVCAVPVVPEP